MKNLLCFLLIVVTFAACNKIEDPAIENEGMEVSSTFIEPGQKLANGLDPQLIIRQTEESDASSFTDCCILNYAYDDDKPNSNGLTTFRFGCFVGQNNDVVFKHHNESTDEYLGCTLVSLSNYTPCRNKSLNTQIGNYLPNCNIRTEVVVTLSGSECSSTTEVLWTNTGGWYNCN